MSEGQPRSWTLLARLALAVVLSTVLSVSGMAQQRGDRSMHTFLQEPEPVQISHWAEGRHDLLLIVAIVNPMGPTLYGLDVLHRPGIPVPELVSFSLNPFDVRVQAHATVARDATRAQLAQLVTGDGRDFGVLKSGPPTLIFPNGQIDEAFRQVLRYHLGSTTNPFRTLDRLRRYPLRSYDRIMEEMDDGVVAARGRGQGRPSTTTSRPLSSSELTEYIDILTRPQHMRDELGSFATAWQGAIQFQIDSGNATLARSAMSWQALVPLLTTLTSPENQRR